MAASRPTTTSVDMLVDTVHGAQGERVEVPLSVAKRYVDGGVARYATKPDARKAGGDPEQASTAR